MLEDVGHPAVARADVTAMPLRAGAFDVASGPHAPSRDRPACGRGELRNVLAPAERASR
jgi:hypothetical protein